MNYGSTEELGLSWPRNINTTIGHENHSADVARIVKK